MCPRISISKSVGRSVRKRKRIWSDIKDASIGRFPFILHSYLWSRGRILKFHKKNHEFLFFHVLDCIREKKNIQKFYDHAYYGLEVRDRS